MIVFCKALFLAFFIQTPHAIKRSNRGGQLKYLLQTVKFKYV